MPKDTTKKIERNPIFAGLTEREEQEVIKAAARAAIRDQRALLKRYAEKFEVA